MKKHRKDRVLADLIRHLGLEGEVFLESEANYLGERLTGDELGAVHRLIQRLLFRTHGVENLPYLDGLTSIGRTMKNRESKP